MENINFGLLAGHLAVYLFVWVFALTAQGALTAWMTNYYGDATAKNEGRISLNPFVQADLFGTIILPAISFIIGWMGAGVPFIAWGKRVPVNAENFRSPKVAGVMVALAATFANLLIALTAFGILKVLFMTQAIDAENFAQIAFNKKHAVDVSWTAMLQLMLWYSLTINIVLTIFSLIPIPPFSGGVALFSFLPESFKPLKEFFYKFGLLIALAMMYLGLIGYVMIPILKFLFRALV